MSTDDAIEGLFLEELTASIVVVLDRTDVFSADFDALIARAAAEGRLAPLQVAFARFTSYQYTSDFLPTMLEGRLFAPQLVRLVTAAGGNDENATAAAIEDAHGALSNEDMWMLTRFVCHLGYGMFQFTGGFAPFLFACRAHAQAVRRPAQQNMLIEPAALITTMIAAGHTKAAHEVIVRFLPGWDGAALFSLWLGVAAHLVPAGRLGLLGLDENGVPQHFTRSGFPAGPPDETGNWQLVLDAVTAARDNDQAAVIGLAARIAALDADTRFLLLLDLASLIASSLPSATKYPPAP